MYSNEIETFLKERDYVLTPEECNVIMDINTNTQIAHIKLLCTNNEHYISTDDGYTFKFRVKGN